MIKLYINDEQISIYQTDNLKSLLELLKLYKANTLVTINQKEVFEEFYDKTKIRDGDQVKIKKLYNRIA